MGILLMYDVTSLESFNNLSYWLRNIQEVGKTQLQPYLVVTVIAMMKIIIAERSSGRGEGTGGQQVRV